MNDSSSHKCVSCGADFSGMYCNSCGEKKITKENQRIVYFFGQIVDEIAFWDTKFFRTLKFLLFKPGFLAKEFIDGRRNLYTKPVALFFIANLLYFFIQPVDTLNSDFTTQVKHQKWSEYVMDLAQNKIKNDNITYEELKTEYNKKSPDNSRIFVVLIVFLFSLPLSLLYFDRKRYYLEHLIFSFSFISALIYTLFFILPLLMYGIYLGLKYFFDFHPVFDINGPAISLSIITLIAIYLIIALKSFYRQNIWLSVLKGIILTISSVAIILGYKFLLFIITINMI